VRSEKQPVTASVEDNIQPKDFDEFRHFLEVAAGIVLGDNKAYLVTSRLNRLMLEQNIDTFSELMASINQDDQVAKLAIDAMTTNETSWFRDNFPYEILKHKLLPDLVSSKPDRIRIWSAACATGQEPYSIRMVVEEYLQKNIGQYKADRIEITGTDLSSTALDMAKRGIYDNAMAGRGLLSDQKQRYFTQNNHQWHLADVIKQGVNFRELNLKESYATLGRFDIIYCRNVMIYFSAELKVEVLNKMAGSLNQGGILIVGGSESVTNYCDKFELLNENGGVVYRLL